MQRAPNAWRSTLRSGQRWATALVDRRKDMGNSVAPRPSVTVGLSDPVRGCRAPTSAVLDPASRRWRAGANTGTGVERSKDHRLVADRIVCEAFPVPPVVAECPRARLAAVYMKNASPPSDHVALAHPDHSSALPGSSGRRRGERLHRAEWSIRLDRACEGQAEYCRSGHLGRS